MFGTANRRVSGADLRRLKSILSRAESIDTLSSLLSLLRDESVSTRLDRTAFGIDANSLLRLHSHKARDEILDYWSSKLEAPLIIPGQVLQEYWNNEISVIKTISVDLKDKFNALKGVLEKVTEMDAGFQDSADEIVERFSNSYGFLLDERAAEKAKTVIESLSKSAAVSYVPRLEFNAIGRIRHEEKAPPGFKDKSIGDFFVWADFLLGLQQSKKFKPFERVVFVTQDKKKDWSRGGAAHPVLTAEIEALFGTSFELWDLDFLGSEIAGT